MLRKIMLLACFLCVATYVRAADKICTKDEAMKAESETDTLKDWTRVYKSYKRYRHCDDGAISEGYSDKICHLLAQDWQHVDVLDKYIVKDEYFSAFIIKHIDETARFNDLKKIFENSSKLCPSQYNQLCKSLVERLCLLGKVSSKHVKRSLLSKDQIQQFCR